MNNFEVNFDVWSIQITQEESKMNELWLTKAPAGILEILVARAAVPPDRAAVRPEEKN